MEERTRESNHLLSLVEKMEASATNDEVIRTQLEDLRSELANSEGTGIDSYKPTKRLISFSSIPATVKSKTDEILLLKKDLKEREELIQQREIDISCLRGQVNQALIDLEAEDDDDDDSDTLTFCCSDVDDEVFLEDLMSVTRDVGSRQQKEDEHDLPDDNKE